MQQLQFQYVFKDVNEMFVIVEFGKKSEENKNIVQFGKLKSRYSQ